MGSVCGLRLGRNASLTLNNNNNNNPYIQNFRNNVSYAVLILYTALLTFPFKSEFIFRNVNLLETADNVNLLKLAKSIYAPYSNFEGVLIS